MRGDSVQAQLVGIDWGTTNRRAYVMDSAGGCVLQHEDGNGVLATGGQFLPSLQALLEQLKVPASTPVLMSGMVGSAQGWQQVPYLDCATPLEKLPQSAVPVRDAPPGCQWKILPGYCCKEGHGGSIDVMRGEETQLLGAMALGHADGWIVLPGTHCKWVQLRRGRIVRLATYMTGELFAMLAASGTLAPLMAAGPDGDPVSLARGVAMARNMAPLSNALFGIRAAVVAGAMPATQARSCVSGLLIGTEFASALRHAGNDVEAGAGAVRLVASSALSGVYAAVADLFNVRATLLDPDMVYCAALAQFMRTPT
ncbi:2-dehydro-3-deoxygalactonokinase [Pseudoduganella ginsengisoli]|uniref:2-dehydro-3-deoxygalactonokinase n=1 Tax=Pseudoduganella ginsengisoli TaxID=1462440 RepID=A0A6L6PVR7_9BURK|nr:2-dehydro-3-deoxygalactonokinase [Pseudoduganella ginsengisoli]MTW01570.1 2-dehydro-3-deoxygalactonokinase [Pseudoduganella ginsengisoli]